MKTLIDKFLCWLGHNWTCAIEEGQDKPTQTQIDTGVACCLVSLIYIWISIRKSQKAIAAFKKKYADQESLQQSDDELIAKYYDEYEGRR